MANTKGMFSSWEAFLETAKTKTFITGIVMIIFGAMYLYNNGTSDMGVTVTCVTNILAGIALVSGRDAIRSSTAKQIEALNTLINIKVDNTKPMDQEGIEKVTDAVEVLVDAVSSDKKD